jgi:5'-nucleotidase
MRHHELLLATTFLGLATSGVALADRPASRGPDREVNVQILAVNDFHGNLQPPSGSSGRIGSVNAGGVEYLATHLASLRALNPNTVVVSAGDMIGASPLLSALFHDEPTIEAFNLIGLDFNAVGNHEFDEGIDELIRLQEGGCHPVDGCLDGDGFDGAGFRFLAANVTWKNNGKTVFPAFRTRTFNGVHVAFIGMTLEGTPSIVSPSGIAALDFADEADTVNALIPELKRRGIEAVVVVVHEGGAPTGGYNECPAISGAIVDIVGRLDDAVDLVVSGHTHQAYNCRIANSKGRAVPVSSAASFGRLVSKIDLTLDRATRDVAAVTIDNRIVTRDVATDPQQTALIAKYNAIAAPLQNRIIGSIQADITRTLSPAGESALGDVIADGQLYATREPAFGAAVVAFMNPGGIRTDLAYAGSPAGEGDGNVTYGEMFTVQPFGNSLVTMTLTGAQIDTLLEQQFVGCGQPPNGQKILQVSAGFSYAWNSAASACNKVDPSTIKLGGATIDPAGRYRVTVNSFLADGGDNFLVLKQGTDRLGGAVDTDAFEAYFAAFSPVAPGPKNRITAVP